ncbi:hypothetical protein [Streptacidiphilus rugosus]|uniref:hypothetical protein n=1 Tax=Streptacidiphilus rugosus TaxID=405783 RepID=UPI000569B178|nr:hypothetical protein [Streptacidiphilus rugosus]
MDAYSGDYSEVTPALREYAAQFAGAIAEVRAEHSGKDYDIVREALAVRLRSVGIAPVPQVLDDLSRQIHAGER